MTIAEQSLREGKPGEALDKLQQQVRDDPANPKLRVFLFQLLSVLGRWDRALTQLNVAAELDAANLLMAQVGRAALAAEAVRADVFAGRTLPVVFGQPQEWIGWMVRANQLGATGQYAEAAALRERAMEAAPAIAGDVDGQPFEWIADADPRLGPIVEAIIDGKYFWVPLVNVRQLQIDKPTDLRDLVWTPANFTWTNGGSAVGFIPTRYPGSEASADPAIQMGRKTEWIEHGEGTQIGLGQRLFATDSGDLPLLELRALTLGAADAGVTSDPASTDESLSTSVELASQAWPPNGADDTPEREASHA